ncbi:MAG TPA: 5-formyltetrahydrofolate cyclo-ligase [Acidimicrobiales bacterium]|nr:5-formyltetrahydrofolate cyclo-ligase [Acidimicrobiales bacterium]
MARRPPRHDHDAGGDARRLEAKAALRAQVWRAVEEAGVARFPGAEGRIPNFTGAEEAAERLRSTAPWRDAQTLKSNPDAPQWPVRQRALEDGKVVYMAVPRLAEARPFFLLDPQRLADPPRRASSIKGASRSAVTVELDELEPVDLVVVGCVAVGEDGARLGKGGGFSDLEYAVAAEAGLIGPGTVVVTTVHDVQVRPAGTVPCTDHDVAVDLVVTPTRVIEAPRRRPRLDWSQLTDEKVASIPLLEQLRRRS